MEKIKIFLCYSNEDYEFTKEIKEFLECFNLNVFLAHTSIEPSKEWIPEIHKEISESNIIIPILTKDFKKSCWTDQECGIAYNARKKFIPISLDDTIPYGFIGHIHTLRFDNQSEDKRRWSEKIKIIKALLIQLDKDARDIIISSLKRPYTSTYKMADLKFEVLENLEPFCKEEINEIVNISINNSQIYENFNLKSKLKELNEKYQQFLEDNLKEQLLFKIDPSYEKLLEIIIKLTKLTKLQIEEKVNEKKVKLDNMISDIGAAQIVAYELGVKI